jgi:hypothetical protein
MLIRARHNSTHQKDTIGPEQSERFDRLEQMTAALTDRVGSVENPAQPESHHYLMQIPINDCTKSLIQGAQSIASSATTATSRSASSQTVVLGKVQAFDYIGITGVTTEAGREETTTGSEFGTPLNPHQRTYVQSWLQHTRLP